MIGSSWNGEKYLTPPTPKEAKTMTTSREEALAERRARLAALAEIHDQWLRETPGADLGRPGPGTSEDTLHEAIDAAGIFPPHH
ncbi:MAG: hypothetical protein JWL58_7226 [Streptosporangiaceae bacterium]|jgi:hypothetical protein|nr:hypothetical protein [Streptosporangiaceae bacterium]